MTPMHQPASTSEGKWTPTYILEIPIRRAIETNTEMNFRYWIEKSAAAVPMFAACEEGNDGECG